MKNEFREDPSVSSGDTKENGEVSATEIKEKGWLSRWTEALLQMGLGESMLRVGTSLLSLVVIIAVVWMVRIFFKQTPDVEVSSAAAQAPTPTPSIDVEDVVPLAFDVDYEGIPRMAQPFTTIPSRPRQEVASYTVQEGDTVFGSYIKWWSNTTGFPCYFSIGTAAIRKSPKQCDAKAGSCVG